jgi:hypothetical protein
VYIYAYAYYIYKQKLHRIIVTKDSVTMNTRETKYCEAEDTSDELGDDDDNDEEEDEDDGDDAGEEDPLPFTIVILTFMPWPQ